MRSVARATSASASTTSAIILADDLTGAADSAAPFAAFSPTTRVTSTAEDLQHPLAQVMACALDTRNLPINAAVQRLTDAVNLIPQPAPDILLCKIDSAGRGHIGESVLTAQNTARCDWALVTPAFPAQGRRVRSGILRVAAPGSRNHEGGAQIPLKALFPDAAQQILANISVANPDDLAQGISATLDDGKRILLGDAETEGDLANLVDAARRVQRGRILWCGSAALARAVAESYFAGCSKQTHVTAPFHAGRCSLLLVGTPHAVTNGQMETLCSMSGVLCIDASSVPEELPEDTRCVAVRVRCGETSDLFVQRIFSLTQRYGGGCGLVLTGGDTALMVLKALGARSILLEGEVEAGIPWGILEGGMADGIRVITKSGGFGARTALVDAVNFLEQTR